MIPNILHLRLKFMQYMKSSPTKSTKAHCGCASDENFLTTDSKIKTDPKWLANKLSSRSASPKNSCCAKIDSLKN